MFVLLLYFWIVEEVKFLKVPYRSIDHLDNIELYTFQSIKKELSEEYVVLLQIYLIILRNKN